MTHRDRIAALGLCALVVGLSFLVPSAPGDAFELIRVNLRETLMEPCRFPTSRQRTVVVVGVPVAPADAARVESIEITGALGDFVVSRQRQMCEVTGRGRTLREACLAEACDTGTCTIRIPLEASADQSGTVRVRTRSEVWGQWTSARLQPSPKVSPAPPVEVLRERDTMSVSGPPSASMRVSVLARGRVVADSPLSLDADGKASFKVPPGTERAMIAASVRGDGGISQSTVHVAAPFDDACETP